MASPITTVGACPPEITNRHEWLHALLALHQQYVDGAWRPRPPPRFTTGAVTLCKEWDNILTQMVEVQARPYTRETVHVITNYKAQDMQYHQYVVKRQAHQERRR